MKNLGDALGDRRRFLKESAFGLGTLAFGHLLRAQDRSSPPHFPSTAKSVIFLFMAGAPSQLDLYDPKPSMRRWHGEPVPPSLLKNLHDPIIRGSARVMASPRTFIRHGACGLELSDYLPHLGTVADEICLIRSMWTDQSNHHPAQLALNCGTAFAGHPSMGSWVTYGLGSQNANLPAFAVLLSTYRKGPEGGAQNWTSGFLPSPYRGVSFRGEGDAVLHLSNPPGLGAEAQKARIEAVRELNRERYRETLDPEISSRIASYELAYRMQADAPELLDFSGESAETLKSYGLTGERTRAFGRNCLLARRMVERGVRFVQLCHSNWDDHSELDAHLKVNCEMTDQPAAALVRDLKRRGLLDQTLVVWAGEFGRTPMNEVRRGTSPGKEGRDHHPYAFSLWMAGGGIKGGLSYGATDDLGYSVIEKPVHPHDLQATILHALGMDHTRLTYRFGGRDFRLTDVGGKVLHELF